MLWAGRGGWGPLTFMIYRRRGKIKCVRGVFGDEIGGRWTAFFPSFEKDSEDDQEGSGGVGEDDGRGVQEDAVGEPEKNAGEIEDQHAVREIASALLWILINCGTKAKVVQKPATAPRISMDCGEGICGGLLVLF